MSSCRSWVKSNWAKSNSIKFEDCGGARSIRPNSDETARYSNRCGSAHGRLASICLRCDCRRAWDFGLSAVCVEFEFPVQRGSPSEGIQFGRTSFVAKKTAQEPLRERRCCTRSPCAAMRLRSFSDSGRPLFLLAAVLLGMRSRSHLGDFEAASHPKFANFVGRAQVGNDEGFTSRKLSRRTPCRLGPF